MTQELYTPADVTVQQFIEALFPPELLVPGETPLIARPASFVDDEGRTVNYHQQLIPTSRSMKHADKGEHGWLYCVSTVRYPDEDERVRRRLEDIRSAFVLPCDDIGTKAEPPPVEPTYVLETSPGNFQYGYAIDPVDVSTQEGERAYDACLRGLALAGFNDKGCIGGTRVIKLPRARHKTGFNARLVDWHPERCWDLDELMQEMGVEPVARRRSLARVARDPDFVSPAIEDLDDPVLRWLQEKNLYLGGRGGGDFHDVVCPWHHEHTDGGISAGYIPAGSTGVNSRVAFSCFHGHCQERKTREFLAWVREQGGPDLSAPVQRQVHIPQRRQS